MRESTPSLAEPKITNLATRSLAPERTVTGTPAQLKTNAVDTPQVSTATTSVVAPLSVAKSVVAGVLSLVGLGSAAGTDPAVPADSPLMWTLLAAVRNRWGQPVSKVAPETKVGTTLSSQNIGDESSGVQSFSTLAFAAAADAPPTAAPAQLAPNQQTGLITGSINGVDPDGGPVTYAVAGTAPTSGTVAVNATTGTFTYTPTQAARLAAGTTAGADFDSFTVNVADGTANTTPVTVQVAVLPAVISGPTSSQVGSTPMGAAVSATKTYVANQSSNSVSVIDRTTGTVSTIANVGTSPRAIALSPDGTRAYVARTNGVAVINTATNTVVTSVTTNGGDSYGIAVSPNGQRVYVSNAGNSTVSVIDTTTATPSLIATVSTGGLTPTGLAVSPDGTRVYVANYLSGNVRVINTATNQALGSLIAVGALPFGVAISPDGTNVYVSNSGSNTVSVINTATNTAGSPLTVGSQPSGMAVSPDGSLLYVANGPDTLSVINTTTKTVLRTVTIDAQAETNWHQVAVSPDGRQVYISDMSDAALRTLSFNRGNTAPIAGTPAVGAPDTSGAVSGLLNFRDTDGDSITYSVTQPSTGNVTTTAAGGYTFTPSQAARDAAAAGGPTSTSFTVIASDAQGYRIGHCHQRGDLACPATESPAGGRHPERREARPVHRNRNRLTELHRPRYQRPPDLQRAHPAVGGHVYGQCEWNLQLRAQPARP